MPDMTQPRNPKGTSTGGQFANKAHSQAEAELGESVTRTVRPDGTEEWWNAAGQRHREDGPAIIYPSGVEHWYQDDRHHREDSPAFIHPDSYEAWFQHGKFHREDVPAITRPDGTREWWERGECVSREGDD